MTRALLLGFATCLLTASTASAQVFIVTSSDREVRCQGFLEGPNDFEKLGDADTAPDAMAWVGAASVSGGDLDGVVTASSTQTSEYVTTTGGTDDPGIYFDLDSEVFLDIFNPSTTSGTSGAENMLVVEFVVPEPSTYELAGETMTTANGSVDIVMIRNDGGERGGPIFVFNAADGSDIIMNDTGMLDPGPYQLSISGFTEIDASGSASAGIDGMLNIFSAAVPTEPVRWAEIKSEF